MERGRKSYTFGICLAVLLILNILNLLFRGRSTRNLNAISNVDDFCPSGFHEHTEDLLCKKPLQFDKKYKNPCWHSNDGRLNCLPYFLLFGMQKCGSTDLFEAIIKHPEVVRPNTITKKRTTYKELSFFNLFHYDNTSLFMSFKEYTECFRRAAKKILKDENNNFITGEGTGDYFWRFSKWQRYPQNLNLIRPRVLLPDLVRHILPEVKLIAMLRDPTERTRSSHFFFHPEIKDEEALRREFHTEIETEINELKQCMKSKTELDCMFMESTLESFGGKHIREHRYVAPSLYSFFYIEWLKVFPKDQILLLDFDDYKSDKAAVLRKVYRFLEIRPLSKHEMIQLKILKRRWENTGRKIQKGSINKTLTVLDHFFQPFNQRFCSLINTSFNWCKTVSKH